MKTPFDLDDPVTYQRWRAAKLASPPMTSLAIADLAAPSREECAALLAACSRHNFALFRSRCVPTDVVSALHAFAKRLGLQDVDHNLCAEEDGLTAITVRRTPTDQTYIPYTDRPLGWHTDGYYNPPHQEVHAWLLYCVQPAAEGGANTLLDHEIAYIRVRDQNPAWIAALMADDAFTIPANVEAGRQIRAAQSGPVFSVSPSDGTLHMRYSARQRNVVWKDDPSTRAAAEFLRDLFQHGDAHMSWVRLQPGEGVISNNVLHRRDGFRDDPSRGVKRLFYRARYYQRLPAPTED